MDTYFVFSDEAGSYKRWRVNRLPLYFVRSALFFNSDHWINIKSDLDNIKEQRRIPKEYELKWSHIWSLFKYKQNNRTIDTRKPFYPFKDFSINELLDYVKDVLALPKTYDDTGIILTVTLNENTPRISKDNIYKMHLQDLMQRIEMHMHPEGNLAILFFDQENKNTEILLRQHYCTLYTQGDFIEKYSHIKDSICFELSHQSFGIQMADYIAGIFNGMLSGYDISKQLFNECVMPLIRGSESGEIFGYGVIEIPKKEANRQILRSKFEELNLNNNIPF